MQTDKNTNIEHIIAKLDNDFNLDNSDYVPRVAAWVIEALGLLNCIRTERLRKELDVHERIAMASCLFGAKNIKVYDNNGCEITKLDRKGNCCSSSSTGTLERSNDERITGQVNRHEGEYPVDGNAYATTIGLNKNTNAIIHQVVNVKIGADCAKHYILIDDNKIELTFDTDKVIVEYDGIKTSNSCMYGCELPVVPNNALVIEAVTYYCMYKILCRGVKHPVFNLHASQYGTNPYYMWTQMKSEAKRSAIIDEQGNLLENDGDLWDSALQLFSFD